MNDLLEGIGPMSTKQQHKQKLNELAKDLNISNQELIDFIKEKLDVEKKASASLENEEVNKILEIFTLDRQVDSFNEYFALRNKPAAKPVKEEPKPQQAEKKKPVNKAKVKDEAATVQSKEQPKQPVNNTEPVKKSAEHPAQVKNTQQPEKPVQQPVKKPEQNKQSAEIANKAEQKSQLERFNNQLQKATEQKNKQQNNSVVEQKQPVQQKQQTVKTKLTVNIADTPVRDNKIHTVDTRGFYVEMDKYNEKYENIAPTQGGKRKDNYTK